MRRTEAPCCDALLCSPRPLFDPEDTPVVQTTLEEEQGHTGQRGLPATRNKRQKEQERESKDISEGIVPTDTIGRWTFSFS